MRAGLRQEGSQWELKSWQCRNFKFWLTLTKNENKLSQIAYNDIKWNENKAFWSKKIKSLLEQIGLGELWMKAHYADLGIVNMIRQRLKDIALQRWLSEINNDTRNDANQSNKMRTCRLFKTVVNRRPWEERLHSMIARLKRGTFWQKHKQTLVSRGWIAAKR